MIGLIFGAASITYAGWSLASVDASAASEETQNRLEDAENDGAYQQVDESVGTATDGTPKKEKVKMVAAHSDGDGDASVNDVNSDDTLEQGNH